MKFVSGPGPAGGHTHHGSLALVGLLVVPCSFAVQQCVSCTVHVAVERPPALHAQSFALRSDWSVPSCLKEGGGKKLPDSRLQADRDQLAAAPDAAAERLGTGLPDRPVHA